ncbi:hypothetical protein BgAZ_105720 [Babesia gibsoni]|uniref:Uncharacterized protein n=1 Tax=Babesia gibsoni TaxID=33632 RepID=A0AAD8PFV9_BABGI|nr:hypothetical protein BgAZ_105720 [Babesia gibsoni]
MVDLPTVTSGDIPTGEDSTPTDNVEGATVVKESLLLLEFPEFQGTSLFDEATFRALSDDDTGTTLGIDNCNFDTIRLENLHTETPLCWMNAKLPLQGKKIATGETFFLFDIEEGGPQQGSDKATVKGRWHTSEYIQFTTPS